RADTLEVSYGGIAVEDRDSGRGSHELVTRVAAAGFVSEVHAAGSRAELRALIDRGEVIAGLDGPADFSRRIAAGDSGKVQVLVDGRRSNAGQIVVGYLSSIAADVGAEANQPAATPLAVRHWFNPNLVYRWFIVPGLVGILAFFSALMLTSLSIARERELRSEEH